MPLNQERVIYFSAVVEELRVGFFLQEKEKVADHNLPKESRFWKTFLKKRTGSNLLQNLNSSVNQPKKSKQAMERRRFPTPDGRMFFPAKGRL